VRHPRHQSRTVPGLLFEVRTRVGMADRRAQRGSRFVGLGEDLNREETMFAGSVVRFLRRRVHSSMRGPVACFEIVDRPPAASSIISVRLISDVPIRYSTVGVVSSAKSAEPSSGKLLR
jgi:hypothetical protein